MTQNWNMEKFLNWYSEHNTGIIQFLIILISLVIAYLVYRLFFGASTAVQSSSETVSLSSASNQKIDVLDKKMSFLIENMSKDPVPTSLSTATKTDTVNSNTDQFDLQNSLTFLTDLLKQKENEIEKLKQSLSQERTTHLTDAKFNSESQPATTVQPTQTVAVSDSDQNQELQSRISDLESKLQEYEIISEDIAELQTLKLENEKLKEQLGLNKTSQEG